MNRLIFVLSFLLASLMAFGADTPEAATKQDVQRTVRKLTGTVNSGFAALKKNQTDNRDEIIDAVGAAATETMHMRSDIKTQLDAQDANVKTVLIETERTRLAIVFMICFLFVITLGAVGFVIWGKKKKPKTIAQPFTIVTRTPSPFHNRDISPLNYLEELPDDPSPEQIREYAKTHPVFEIRIKPSKQYTDLNGEIATGKGIHGPMGHVLIEFPGMQPVSISRRRDAAGAYLRSTSPSMPILATRLTSVS
jgi:hypothetical protein